MPILAAGLATMAMWSIEQHVKEIGGINPLREMAQFLWLRQGIQLMLSLSSAILVFGVANLFARRAVVQSLAPENFLSEEQIMLQAFLYTVMIGLSYIPAYLAVNRAAAKLRDAILPAPTDASTAALLERQRASSAIDETLQIRLHDWKSLGPGFAILAPVMVGLATNIVTKHL